MMYEIPPKSDGDRNNNNNNNSSNSNNGNGNSMIGTASNTINSSSSRSLRTYFILLVVIIGTMGIVTVSSMEFLGSAFGRWGLSNPFRDANHNGDNHVSSIRVRNITTTSHKNKKDKLDKAGTILEEWIVDVNQDEDYHQGNIKVARTEHNKKDCEKGFEYCAASDECLRPARETCPDDDNNVNTNKKGAEKPINKNKKKQNNKQQKEGQGKDKEEKSIVHGQETIIEVIPKKDNDKSKEEEKKGDVEETKETKIKDRGDTTTTKSLLESVRKAQKQMVKQLRKDYGNDYYEQIFHTNANSAATNHDTERTDQPKATHFMKYRYIRPSVYTDQDGHRRNYQHDQDKDKTTGQQIISNLQRKLIIKLLQSQKLAAHQTNKKNQKEEDDENYASKALNRYVWATGGHSAAAGHGNLFQESYTKVMEHTAKDVFASVGLIFEARNYAMGATASAAEMSMCFSQIFGDDVDIFSWDYGMLEARDYLRGRYLHYVTRGLLSRNPDHFSTTGIATPAFVALQEIGNGRKHILSDLTKAFLTTNTNNDDKKKKKKKDNNSNSDDGNDDEKDPPIPENNGLALFLGDEYLFKEMKEAIPETLGMSGAEIKDLPPYVRNFKCNNALENGDPYCGDEKYSTEVCPKRMGMASWHPGWKYQAMVGNSMALFLVDQLVDAVQTIDDTEDDELEFLLERLVQEEQQYYTQLLEGPLPEFAKVVYWYNNTDDHTREYPEMTPTEQALLDVNRKQYQDRNRTAVPSKFEQEKLYQPLADYETWFRGPSMCHTARLPAQTRYTGAVSNTRILNGQDPARYERIFPEVVSSFDVGTEDAQLHQQWEQNYTAKYGTSDEEEVEERRWNRQRKVRRLEPVDEEDDDNRNNINHPLQLSYVMNNEREQYACPDCATVTRIDYRDFFYVDSFVDGWSSFTFPNDVEQVQYRYQQNRDKFKGILVLVFRYCGFGECEEGFLGPQEYNAGRWKMLVNGREVSKMTQIGHEAIVLENERDGVYFPPNEEGVYEIRMQVMDSSSFIKLSAFILY